MFINIFDAFTTLIMDLSVGNQLFSEATVLLQSKPS